MLRGILVHVSTKPSASTPPPSGKVPRAVGTAQGRASLMLHALIYLIFGIITVFVQTPDNVFTKILLGLWMLALGTSHALTARGMHYGPATSASLSSTALVQAASGALLVIMPDTLALIILAVCAGSGLPGLIKLLWVCATVVRWLCGVTGFWKGACFLRLLYFCRLWGRSGRKRLWEFPAAGR